VGFAVLTANSVSLFLVLMKPLGWGFSHGRKPAMYTVKPLSGQEVPFCTVNYPVK
jgi:hypothetical protein